MPRPDYARCKNCGALREHAGMMSCTRLCPACSHRLLHENVDGIHEREGFAHERRLYGVVREALGPRVALALKQAGVFPSLLDESEVKA